MKREIDRSANKVEDFTTIIDRSSKQEIFKEYRWPEEHHQLTCPILTCMEISIKQEQNTHSISVGIVDILNIIIHLGSYYRNANSFKIL